MQTRNNVAGLTVCSLIFAWLLIAQMFDIRGVVKNLEHSTTSLETDVDSLRSAVGTDNFGGYGSSQSDRIDDAESSAKAAENMAENAQSRIDALERKVRMLQITNGY